MDSLAAYYQQILGVEPGASPEEVRRAYRRLVKTWHPDLVHNDPCRKKAAEEMTKEINEAYGRLRYQWHGPRTCAPRADPRAGQARRSGNPASGEARQSEPRRSHSPRREASRPSRLSGWTVFAVIMLFRILSSPPAKELMQKAEVLWSSFAKRAAFEPLPSKAGTHASASVWNATTPMEEP